MSASEYRVLRSLFVSLARHFRARIRRQRLPFGGDPANGYPVDSAAIAGLAETRRNMARLRANRRERAA